MTDTTETKRFHIGDILSVTTERLVSPRHMEGLYDLLGWLAGEDLMTHQLSRVSDEAAPFLRQWFPDLADVEVPDLNRDEHRLLLWLDSLGEQYRDVPRMPSGQHAHIDPLLEAAHQVGAGRVIPVVLSESTQQGDGQ